MKKKIICKICKKEKEHHAKGLCDYCYQKYSWKRKKIICKRCGRLRYLKGKGLCGGCYNTIYMLEYNKAWNYKKDHNIDLETYKKITKTCVICGFDKFVVLHHLDGNHKNNLTANLIGLCPNHHQMLHTLKYKDEILTKLKEKGYDISKAKS